MAPLPPVCFSGDALAERPFSGSAAATMACPANVPFRAPTIRTLPRLSFAADSAGSKSVRVVSTVHT